MRYNKRKARLGANQPSENSRMIARSRKIRKGNLVRLAPSTNRSQDSIYEWLKDRVGVVTEVHPMNWDVHANFSFTVYNMVGAPIHYNRLFGFWDFDLELVRR